MTATATATATVTAGTATVVVSTGSDASGQHTATVAVIAGGSSIPAGGSGTAAGGVATTLTNPAGSAFLTTTLATVRTNLTAFPTNQADIDLGPTHQRPNDFWRLQLAISHWRQHV